MAIGHVPVRFPAIPRRAIRIDHSAPKGESASSSRLKQPPSTRLSAPAAPRPGGFTGRRIPAYRSCIA
ncbi:hypothetical protein OCGS_0012 [Oceaniovalibus guishaninsula JLT2003]|uniref:Uncharacterized protein n=1 Tax=Oceaniovalibus guishaninsula JLT2003 TaxID=1231392 RepID=K2GTA5_9RHOB|nr:hypothetical protein OCGS_0012 [Oceaniovalibus guishaninsula JLT2003]